MNTKPLLLLAPFLFLLFLLSSCGDCSRKIDCPGFADDTLSALFPYINNQQLAFLSDTAGRDIFHLENTRTSEPYQAASGAYGSAPRCAEEKVFASREKDTSNRSYFEVILQSGDYRAVNLKIKTSSISFTNFSDTAFTTVFINGQYAPQVFRQSVAVGNRTFAGVIIAGRDTSTNKRAGIYRIFYTRKEGVVGYTEFPSGINWVKQ